MCYLLSVYTVLGPVSDLLSDLLHGTIAVMFLLLLSYLFCFMSFYWFSKGLIIQQCWRFSQASAPSFLFTPPLDEWEPLMDHHNYSPVPPWLINDNPFCIAVHWDTKWTWLSRWQKFLYAKGLELATSLYVAFAWEHSKHAEIFFCVTH